MCKWVVNQDKDRIVKIEDNEFKCVLVYNDGIFIAWNLIYDNILMGTFNGFEELFMELKHIYLNDFLYIIKEF